MHNFVIRFCYNVVEIMPGPHEVSHLQFHAILENECRTPLFMIFNGLGDWLCGSGTDFERRECTGGVPSTIMGGLFANLTTK